MGDVWAQERWNADLERRIRAALQEIKFGTVTLIIQDSKVIQIDKSEKIRLS
ncbi:YezD family protein [Geotalea sp. SG265]|uniref:YezD family protein n=1 Tax=Geotalea sp. SG265 TaxID=2922867 RepID=UPI001FAF2EF4|nr:YezD family protein [Geotalea sp. SG265]